MGSPEEMDVRPSRVGPLTLLAALTLVGCAASTGEARPSTGTHSLQEAKNAFFKLDLKAARRAFEQALQDTATSAAERAEAARRLANIAWRFDKEWARADALLLRAEDLEADSFENALERVRLLQSRGSIDDALAAAREALTKSPIPDKRIRVESIIGQLRLLQARAASELSERHRADLRSALDDLLPTVRNDQGRLEPAKVALELALLIDDGKSALEAWRSYYQVPPALDHVSSAAVQTDSWGYPSMAPAHAVLTLKLPSWEGPGAAADDRAAVVLALADSKFFAAASWLAGDSRIGPSDHIDQRPRVADVIAYQRYFESVENLTDRLYRRRALGHSVANQFDEELRSAARALWEQLHFAEDRPRFSKQGFWKEISRRFGTQVYFRTDRGGHAIHLGHRVVDDRREVKQYGRSTAFRFVVVDAMATNGYTSWYWDGQASTGGWVDDDGAVVQVRSAYSEGPLEAWSQLIDPHARKAADELIRKKTLGDDAIARANPHAYLPGMTLRIKRQAHQRLLSQLRGRGLECAPLKSAFVRELGRLVWEASIFAHEGRHALERQNVPKNWFRSSAEKEFLAKLSEVALAPDPRIGLLGGILSPNIGDGSSHGQANQRLMKGLVEWMKAHASEIQDLDTARPYLPQLDLLTDEQLRQAFRSFDPWVR